MARSIENIYSSLSTINDKLTTVIDQARKVSADSSVFGGEISRVVGEQFDKYFIPAIEKLMEDENTPGSIIGVTLFLDSLPLAMARQGFAASEYNLPDTTEGADLSQIEVPSGSLENSEGNSESKILTDVDKIPQKASYVNPEGVEETAGVEARPYLEESQNSCFDKVKSWAEFDACVDEKSAAWKNRLNNLADKYVKAVEIKKVQNSSKPEEEKQEEIESIKKGKKHGYKDVNLSVAKALVKELYGKKKITEKYIKYQVVRTSTVTSALSEDLSKIKPVVVAEYNNEEEANKAAERLNGTVENEEKELLGTNYCVECKEFEREHSVKN